MRMSVVVLCAFLLVLPSRTSLADDPLLPPTAPARRFSEILALVNEGDPAALTAYAIANFVPGMLQPDPGSIVEFLVRQHEANGGYAVRRVLQSSDEQITVLVQGRRAADRWMRLVVGVEPAPPHAVRGIFLFPASAALAGDDEGPVKEAELPVRLAGLVDRMAAEGDFSGSLCLSRGGKTVLHLAWGEADREAHTANRPETRFNIASLGKMFTAVAIAQLVERGSLRYDDRVAERIPDWLAQPSRGITVEQLLTHTSGLGDYLDSTMADRSTRRDRLADYRAIAVRDTPAFEPGTQFRYSNTGFLLLGALIERVSGEPWDRYLERNVFRPAGMTATGTYCPGSPEDGVAIGYMTSGDGRWARNDRLLAGCGTPAGGSVSTSRDLVAFANALRSGALVSAATLDRLTRPSVEMVGTGLMYGLGFTVARGEPGHRIYGHAGGFPGVGALLEVYEDEGWVLAVLSNRTAAAQDVGDAWRDLLRRSSGP